MTHKTRTPRGGMAVITCLAASLLAAPASLRAQAGTQELKLTIGKSVVIDYPSDVGRISTSNPDVVDAVPITAREILLNAKTFGQSTVVVWSKSGERSFFSINVEPNVEPLQRLLKETFPGEGIDLRISRDSASLNGKVSSPAVADRAVALIVPLVKSVVNNLQIVTPGADKQIVLRVKFAELNRSRVEQLGVNLISTGAANTFGVISTGQFGKPGVNQLSGAIGAPTQGSNATFNLSDVLNIFAFRPELNLGSTIQALQTQNVLQILAEPNLVTTNGKEASFLAGGEFPVPVLQGGGNAGAVTIQFKEFGIRLRFLPQITVHNTVKMHLSSELSTIDLSNSVVFSGFTIPALSTRRAETDVELGPGQSFAIAGLLDDRAADSLFRIPGLGHLPILGHLFRSKALKKDKSELIVLVTPEIATPIQIREGDQLGPLSLLPGQEQHERDVQLTSQVGKTFIKDKPKTPKKN